MTAFSRLRGVDRVRALAAPLEKYGVVIPPSAVFRRMRCGENDRLNGAWSWEVQRGGEGSGRFDPVCGSQWPLYDLRPGHVLASHATGGGLHFDPNLCGWTTDRVDSENAASIAPGSLSTKAMARE